MRRLVSAFAAGLLFGLGLAIAQMTNPDKVLGFLDVAGNWDPSLLLVLGGAVAVTAVTFRFILRRPAPLLDQRFHLSTLRGIDRRLLAGAVIFGAGWGISGYCPGPGIALLAAPSWELWAFIPGLAIGMLLHRAHQQMSTQPADVAARGRVADDDSADYAAAPDNAGR